MWWAGTAGARLAVHVDELREEELDALLADDAANPVGGTRAWWIAPALWLP
jgi:hypothetical protein